MKRRLCPSLPWEMIPVILTLAWPTMLEQLLQTAVQYIDTAMVGSLGTQATAAVGATTTVGWLVGSTISALGIGFLAYISQADGAGDYEKVSRASAQAVLPRYLQNHPAGIPLLPGILHIWFLPAENQQHPLPAQSWAFPGYFPSCPL